MRFNCGESRQERAAKREARIIGEAKRLTNWHSWFAWHPVKVRSECVWMEHVWRRSCRDKDKLEAFMLNGKIMLDMYYEYRTID